MPEENHKGEKCPYANRLCQEGICSNCEIYKIYRSLETKHHGINL